MIANDRDLSGVTMRSSTLPTISPFSLYTLRPRICRLTLHATATALSYVTSTPTVVDPAICALTGVPKTVAKAAVVRVTNPARTEIFMQDSMFEGAISSKNLSESRLAVGIRPAIVSRNADPPCHSVTTSLRKQDVGITTSTSCGPYPVIHRRIVRFGRPREHGRRTFQTERLHRRTDAQAESDR